MAKRKPNKGQSQNNKNLKRAEYYVSKGNEIFNQFLDDLAKLASQIPNINKIKVFTFDDYPAFAKKLFELMREVVKKVTLNLMDGIKDAVKRANMVCDDLVDKVFKATKIPKDQLKKYYNINLQAAATRDIKSELSPRVYKLTNEFRRISELGIDNGIASGKSARNLATEIRKAVKTPDFAYRRVRNSKGNLEWSKAAKKHKKDNPPGKGKHLNPQKNFERLTRTEINMANRTAEHERVQQFDFVVGIKINLSNNPNHCPLCIRLAGEYPSTFLFRGWHPQCRCFKTTILKTREELDRDNKLILEGKEPSPESVNRVTKPHKEFNDWMTENKERITAMKKAGTTPYWILDNFEGGKLVPGRRVGGVSK